MIDDKLDLVARGSTRYLVLVDGVQWIDPVTGQQSFSQLHTAIDKMIELERENPERKHTIKPDFEIEGVDSTPIFQAEDGEKLIYTVSTDLPNYVKITGQIEIEILMGAPKIELIPNLVKA